MIGEALASLVLFLAWWVISCQPWKRDVPVEPRDISGKQGRP